jgi:transcriptional regulator with XRE-family HTH domain
MSPERPVDPERSALAAEIAVRLRELRARHDLTQEQVARAIGCHESAVSRWESAARLPSCNDLIALARVYRVSCDWLLGLSEFVAPPGSALLDQPLLDRLADAPSTAAFDEIVQERREHAVWLPIAEGAVVVPLAEAVRRARSLAERFADSRHLDRLFGGGA